MRDEIPVTEQEEAAWREMELRQARQATQQQASGPAGAPDRIFLVIGEGLPANTTFGTLAEVTWCANRVNDTDIEYVRAQPAAATAFTMDDALAAGDGTLHGAIDYWQGRALKAGTETEGLRAHVALLRASLAQAEREADELRAALAPAHLLERLRRHAADTTNTAFSRSTMTEALQYLERAQAPADNGDAPTARELDMAMLIKRLAATLRVAWPESTYMKAADDAMDALNRWGLAGSPLREGGE